MNFNFQFQGKLPHVAFFMKETLYHKYELDIKKLVFLSWPIAFKYAITTMISVHSMKVKMDLIKISWYCMKQNNKKQTNTSWFEHQR